MMSAIPPMPFIQWLKQHARQLKQQTLVVYFAARDPQMPLLLKLLALFIAAYAFSPIDLIPDFIPVVGYLDDLILLPLGIALVLCLTPPHVLQRARDKATETEKRPSSRLMAAFVIGVWLLLAALICGYGYRLWSTRQ